jgi:hypothetical protein
MNIRKDLDEMFKITSIDHANTNTPDFGNTAKDAELYNEIWAKIQDAYQQGAKDVMDHIFDTYEVLNKEDIDPTLENFSEKTKLAYRKLRETEDDLKKTIDAIVYCQCPEPDRDPGYTYCQRCHKHVSDARMRFLINKDEKLEIPAKEEDPDELERKRLWKQHYDNDFNNLCARATLYPGKSIEEVKLIQMREKIERVYKEMNAQFCQENSFNDELTKGWVRKTLREAFGTQVIIKCDDENNPPEVVGQCLLIARVTWNSDYGLEWQYKYVDMVFGNPEQVEKYQNQQMLDNETFKFIQKGI